MSIPVTPYKIKKAWKYLRHFGPKAFMAHLAERLEKEAVPYAQWFEAHRPDDKTLLGYRAENRPDDLLISVIVPTYETPEKYLREMIDSVRGQTYENWELCIADASDRTDTVRKVIWEYERRETERGTERICYRKLEKNAGIAENTNAGIAMANGEYIGLLDHDDLLAPHALRLIADRIRETGAEMLYTDEDKVDSEGKKHFQPNFKPDYNEDLLRSNNYITHFLTVKRELALRVGGIRSDYNGAQDYDFIFRCAEEAEKIEHIPEILYHWRTHAASTADNPESKLYAYEAGKRAIEGHLARCGESGEVSLLPEYGFYRVKYPLTREPLVSILIPNKDQVKALSACLDALRKTSYQNTEILIIENNSTEEETFSFYETLKKDPKIRILTWKEGFNYSAINNFGAKEAEGEFLLFLNNDVRCVIDPGWLGEMVSAALRKDVGTVGAKLYYPNNRIQHAGIVIGIGGVAGAMFVDLPRARKGYLNKASLMQDMSAVTAACMLMKKSVFEEAGGFEEKLAVAFNDVDLCLRVREKGYLIVYDPFAEAYHDESRTRGAEDSEEKQRRFYTEIDYMRGRWNRILKEGDPYYNKNLSLKRWDYSLREN